MCLAVLATLGVGEVAFRGLVRHRPSVRFEQAQDALRGRANAQFANLIQQDPERFWRLVPGITLPADTRPFFGVISNSQGLRENHEIPRHKGPRELRILFLGDSVTFGYRLANDQSFVEIAEESLQARHPGIEVECINAGVPGYGLFQG